MTEPDREARLARERSEQGARRAELIERHGQPEQIDTADALGLAAAGGNLTDTSVTTDQAYASIYRDAAAAAAWLEANRAHHGHPALATVPLPDGRVIGILDLRPAMKRLTEES